MQSNLRRGTTLNDILIEAGLRIRVNTETLGATRTLLPDDDPIQFLDPGGSDRTITLPAEVEVAASGIRGSKDLTFTIVNTANGNELLTVNDDGGTNICIIGQNERAIIWCDGTTWLGMVMGAAGTADVAQVMAPIPMPVFEIDSTPLVAWSNATTNTPGINLTAGEAFGVRWNDAAAPDPVATSVIIPPDLDETKDVIIHILASKVGATSGDTVDWLIEAFFIVDTDLHDADADAGGTASSMTGAATSKTVQEETLTIAAANVKAGPGLLSLTIQPTDGKLGTDDVTIHAMWLEYTKKLLVA